MDGSPKISFNQLWQKRQHLQINENQDIKLSSKAVDNPQSQRFIIDFIDFFFFTHLKSCVWVHASIIQQNQSVITQNLSTTAPSAHPRRDTERPLYSTLVLYCWFLCLSGCVNALLLQGQRGTQRPTHSSLQIMFIPVYSSRSTNNSICWRLTF